MIRNSFIFLPKVGNTTEKKIWNSGIKDWNDFLSAKNVCGVNQVKKSFCDIQIKKAKQELLNENSSHFKDILPSTETWRLYDYFKDDACFLDIETVGYNGYITVIGIYDGNETKTLVKDSNLYPNELKKLLQQYKLIVTFNGSSFDLPVIERYYPGIIPKVPHIDLRHCCAKLGLKGGLKSIEEQRGIERPKHLKAYGGDNAIDLWRAYRASGDKEYLDLLVQYNEEDIVNLKPIMEYCYNELKTRSLNMS